LVEAVGVRFPPPDACRQPVFFWHNDTFLGWNAIPDTILIAQTTSPALGVFKLWE